MAALNGIAPHYNADGKMVRAEAYQDKSNALADEFVAKQGATLSPLHRQQFPVDQVAVDALHRALAEHPDGVAAFKPVGELTPQDQSALRAVFAREYGKSDPAAEGMRQQLEKLDAAEPEREVEDMFGRGVNPAWREWQAERNGVAEKLNKASMTWGKYLDVMGSPANGYTAMQDVVRSNVLKSFADHHNRLRAEAPLKLGRTVIAHDLNHLDALDPVARDKRIARQRELADSLRNRVAGKYASGAISDKLEAARAAEEAQSQAQMGLFGASELPAATPAGEGRTISRADLDREPGEHKDSGPGPTR